MKHIKTASPAETSMRRMYPEASSPEPIAAGADHVGKVREIIELSRKIDELKLKMSEAMGSLMGYMQGHQTLTDSEGRVLVSWTNASPKGRTDWEGLAAAERIPQSRIDEFTTVVPGSRVFTVLD